MPEFNKPPSELADRFGAAVAALPDVSQRKMFGMPAAFVGGQMFTGLFGGDWFVRLPDDQAAELRSLGGRPFEPMPGRPMRGYVLLPDEVRDDEQRLDSWLQRAHAHTAALPPKKRR